MNIQWTPVGGKEGGRSQWTLSHKDFLQAYVEKSAEAFASEFSGLAIKHNEVLASGQGFVSRMAKRGFLGLEKGSKPR
jgi:hypothetical protein